jgi:hypothetical protein
VTWPLQLPEARHAGRPRAGFVRRIQQRCARSPEPGEKFEPLFSSLYLTPARC